MQDLDETTCSSFLSLTKIFGNLLVTIFDDLKWSMEEYGTTANLNKRHLKFQQEGVIIPHELEDFLILQLRYDNSLEFFVYFCHYVFGYCRNSVAKKRKGEIII